jgi:uncharacterized repeat protein (TIGR03803 family)
MPVFEAGTAVGDADRYRRFFGIGQKVAIAAWATALAIAMATIGSQTAQAQTYNVIYNFTGGRDGASPEAGLTIDRGGNLYGTTNGGGAGYGAVFKLAHKSSTWVLSPLYNFAGGSDGSGTYSGVVFGPDGSLYGVTYGTDVGLGTVFKLQPPATACKTALCPWTETVLYRFTGGSDGANPEGDLTFDQAGSLYGVTLGGGYGFGVVYELTPSNGGWTQSILHSFEQGKDGVFPAAGVIFDKTGNLYGTTAFGGTHGLGVVFQLTPSGSGWTENLLYTFQGGSDGGVPLAGLIFDNSGNLYGATSEHGTGSCGTAFELMPLDGTWSFSLLYSFGGSSGCGPQASLMLDQAGNLYGTTLNGGANGQGSVFKLTPSNGTWIYTSLHDFAGPDGAFPVSNLVFDANGNFYGTASEGGAAGYGVIYQIAP